jgi:hypothetical protein
MLSPAQTSAAIAEWCGWASRSNSTR